MGWASGSTLYSKIIGALQIEGVPPDVRFRIHKRLILNFEDADWDTQDECCGLDVEFDRALAKVHPDWGTDA